MRPHGTAPQATRGRIHCTLLELVCAVGDASGSEEETLATVLHLVRSGRVRLIGTLRDQGIE